MVTCKSASFPFSPALAAFFGGLVQIGLCDTAFFDLDGCHHKHNQECHRINSGKNQKPDQYQ